MKEYQKTVEFNRLPIGTNNAYYHRNNRRFLKPETKTWKEEIGYSFPQKKDLKDGRFGVEIMVEMADNRKRDVDSGVKFILDALSGIVWFDDRQVSEVHIFKTRTKEHKTIISVWQII